MLKKFKILYLLSGASLAFAEQGPSHAKSHRTHQAKHQHHGHVYSPGDEAYGGPSNTVLPAPLEEHRVIHPGGYNNTYTYRHYIEKDPYGYYDETPETYYEEKYYVETPNAYYVENKPMYPYDTYDDGYSAEVETVTEVPVQKVYPRVQYRAKNVVPETRYTYRVNDVPMTAGQARAMLGFSPNAHPSRAEIEQAYNSRLKPSLGADRYAVERAGAILLEDSY